jgi:hypothetical protein
MCCCLVSGGEGWRSSDRPWQSCRTNGTYNLLFFSTSHLHSTTPLIHHNMPFFKTYREMPSPQSLPQAAPPSPPHQLPPPFRSPLLGITDVALRPCDHHPQAALPSPPCQLPPPFRPPLPGGTAVALRPCDRHHFILRLLSALAVRKDGTAKHDSTHGVWRVIYIIE